ncbi:MAG: acyltransferase [Pseudomonadota bacterium]
MSIFRVRDYLSVLLYRIAAGLFGSFGRRVRVVWPMRLVGLKNMHLGDDVTIANMAYIAALREFDEEPRLSLGNGTRLGEFAHVVCTHSVTIGRDVLVANRVFISDCDHAYRDISISVLRQGLDKGRPVSIGDDSWIGENVCIVSASIGRHCVIGANSVVTRDVPDYSVVAGAPARIVRRYCADRQSWLPTDIDGAFRNNDQVDAPATAQSSVQG